MADDMAFPPGALGAKLWTEDNPGLSEGPVEVSTYLSEAYFNRERENIFRNAWLYIGRVSEIPSPNGFITRDVLALKASIIIVRDDKSGKLQAFHNVCRHRQKKLVLEREGTAASFVCGMHGWAFGRDGGLRHVPDQGQFPGLDTSQCGLGEIAVDSWRGFIFVHFSKPQETLREFLGEVADYLESTPFEDCPVAVNSEYETHANWKLVRDANLETYHAPVLHHRSTAGNTTDPLNPYNRPAFAKAYKKHRMFTVGKLIPVSNAPRHLASKSVLSRASQYLNQAYFHDPRSPVPDYANPGKATTWLFDLWFIWPNLTIGIRPGQYSIGVHDPISVDRTITRGASYLPKITNARQLFGRTAVMIGAQNVTAEDAKATEDTQVAMEQRAFPDIFLADSELLIRHAQKVDAEAMAQGPA